MRIIFSVLALLMISFSPVRAQGPADEGETGLTIPRFVSLRSNHINARSGPGARYPIEWVYMQKSAPVEIIAEFELWRKIKDWQGKDPSRLLPRVKTTFTPKTTLRPKSLPKLRTKLSAKLKNVRSTTVSAKLSLLRLRDGCRGKTFTAFIRKKLSTSLSPATRGLLFIVPDTTLV